MMWLELMEDQIFLEFIRHTFSYRLRVAELSNLKTTGFKTDSSSFFSLPDLENCESIAEIEEHSAGCYTWVISEQI